MISLFVFFHALFPWFLLCRGYPLFLDLVQSMSCKEEDPGMVVNSYNDACPQDLNVIKEQNWSEKPSNISTTLGLIYVIFLRCLDSKRKEKVARNGRKWGDGEDHGWATIETFLKGLSMRCGKWERVEKTTRKKSSQKRGGKLFMGVIERWWVDLEEGELFEENQFLREIVSWESGKAETELMGECVKIRRKSSE